MFQMISDMIGFNQSMFSGAMDVIVIRKPNGELASTSFHVRFGSLKVLQSKDKVIEIYINGVKTPLEMRLSPGGDAYFFKSDEDEALTISPLKKSCDKENFGNEADGDFVEDSIEKINKVPGFVSTIRSSGSGIQMSNERIWISNSQKEILESIDKAEELFLKHLIEKEEFFNDPWAVLNSKNIVFLINETLYNSQAALPMIMSLMLYRELLPAKKISELTAKTGMMFSFSKPAITEISRIKLPNLTEDVIHRSKEMISKSPQKPGDTSKKHKYKSFFPSSNQLKSLNLRNERNEICFICKSSVSGTQSLKAEIYLWSSDSKIIISDVDGTITKSDILGQIMPMIGTDWNHQGITELFTNISRNKYKFIYLTARAICQSQFTRDYLMTLFQEKNSLPVGPMLMSPDGLFSSFKREAIDKSPHLLKITTLTEVRTLFPKNYCPFYSGFGNRETDAIAYRSLGIELSKIFIINTKGEITQLNNSIKKTYSLINTIVNELFPVISSVQEKAKDKEESQSH